jgi:ribosomal protein L11 methyltransferase
MRGTAPEAHIMTSSPTTLARLITDEATAKAIADHLSELFEPDELAASAFEMPEADALPTSVPRPSREGAMGTLLPDSDCPWQAELYFGEAPDEDAIRALIADIAGDAAAKAFVFESVAAQDWIATSLEGMVPVDAGRFTIHGAHSRGVLKRNRHNIEIEAALAFGTGHHGTTRGCLLHLDALLKRRRPTHATSSEVASGSRQDCASKRTFNVVDIGSGTGVLAFAAAMATKRYVHAGELDPDSVVIARQNARLNGIPCLVRPVVAAGLQHPELRATRFYDLVFANILARPLRRLAPEITNATAPGGDLILSGLLIRDVPGVLATYRAFGFHLAARIHLEGWASLILRRGGAKPQHRQT